MGGSPLDPRWEANCRDCLRRWAKETSDTVRILPPLIVEEIEVCPKKVAADVEDEVGVGEEIDCDNTDDPVCPWCGTKIPVIEDWGWNARNQVETSCDECGRPFYAVAHYSVSYSTGKLDAGKEGA
jgi:hypothetical protein